MDKTNSNYCSLRLLNTNTQPICEKKKKEKKEEGGKKKEKNVLS